MDRSVQAKKIRLGQRRIIAISDIHGNLPLFQRLLAQVGYKPDEDALLLLGDLIEKGPYSLKTLRYIMELAKHPHVHVLMGNCDFICKNIVHRYNLDFIQTVLQQRKASLLHEMAACLHISIGADNDMEELCTTLLTHFQKELAWVDALPQVLYDERYIFAHAGIVDEQRFGDDFREVLTYPHFLLHGGPFERYVIVGHMPVSEYCTAIASFAPIVNEERHIIAIDGGNIVKQSGQLNAFLIEDGRFSHQSVDDLAQVRVLTDVAAPKHDPLFITWRESAVIVLQHGETRDFCRHIASGRELWIDHAFLKQREDGMHATDFTTYEMPLCKGDIVSLVQRYERFSIIKKEGILGWCRNASIDV